MRGLPLRTTPKSKGIKAFSAERVWVDSSTNQALMNGVMEMFRNLLIIEDDKARKKRKLAARGRVLGKYLYLRLPD